MLYIVSCITEEENSSKQVHFFWQEYFLGGICVYQEVYGVWLCLYGIDSHWWTFLGV